MRSEKLAYWTLCFVATIPVLLIRLIAGTLRRLGLLSRRQRGDQACPTVPLEEQLAANWDERGGYRAGPGIYSSVWTRDSFFAMMAPVPERADRLRALADRLRDSMSADGAAAFTFNEIFYVPSTLLGRPVRRTQPNTLFGDEKFGEPVMDASAQYVIMVSQAFEATRDEAWLRSHAEAVCRAMAFYDAHVDALGRVLEEPFGNWEDSLKFSGAVAYTNVLYLEATRRAAAVCAAVGEASEAARFAKQYTEVRAPVLALVDEKRDTVSVALAVLWGHADAGPLRTAVGELLSTLPDDLTPNRWPVAPASLKAFGLVAIGQGGYHTTFRWRVTRGLEPPTNRQRTAALSTTRPVDGQTCSGLTPRLCAQVKRRLPLGRGPPPPRACRRGETRARAVRGGRRTLRHAPRGV